MDILDERVLRQDEARRQAGAVVLDRLYEPPPLELGEQPELTELRERVWQGLPL